MTERQFDPDLALGARLASMDRQELCRLAIRLCEVLMKQGGAKAYCGGIYPENICVRAGGEPMIGPGQLSDWNEQELQFIPPELYWDGTALPQGDVYAIGLLLYYGVSGGKLPLEGGSPNPQLSRMSGAAFSAPASAGIRLGEIIEKAASFHAQDRYTDVGELRVNLESCLSNKYVTDRAGEELFRKGEENLSEVERMMLDIIAGVPSREAAIPDEQSDENRSEMLTEPERTDAEAASETKAVLSTEETEALILGVSAPEREERDLEAERRALVEEVFGSPEPEPEPAPGLEAGPEDGPETEEETEDVRVYEPSHEKKGHVPIPILTEEKNPELAPVVPKRRSSAHTVEQRSEQIAKTVKKRRTRPIGVVLILCGLLIIAALVANHWLQTYEFDDEGQGRQIAMPTVGDDAIPSGDGFLTVEELERQEESITRQSYYQIFIGDLSWTDAKNACIELGGQLAVINTQDEFTMVTQLAQQNGVQGVWVGCHRESGFLQWETVEPVGTMTWADGEPDYTDSRDGAAEDYIMLWNTGSGWAYIDCRNDPVRADPTIYGGKIGYVCEFENVG